ncbi:hypothetical protein [Azorhizobium doebereinerae]|uniref:hypothetical protein n=1 Tax=Azorhizobium doebereinerae TaxID=281091 RepID=UPI001AEBE41F|nr:hypothetical protein [Azorhizobium doebereinerae]
MQSTTGERDANGTTSPPTLTLPVTHDDRPSHHRLQPAKVRQADTCDFPLFPQAAAALNEEHKNIWEDGMGAQCAFGHVRGIMLKRRIFALCKQASPRPSSLCVQVSDLF